MRSQYVNVSVDLARIRANAAAIRARTGVPLIAVVKADAYGLGAAQVAAALDGVADEFAYFNIHEARAVGRPGIVLGPPDAEPGEYVERGLRPAVGNRRDAERYRDMPVLIELDTGMQRFGCAAGELGDLLRISGGREVFTHGNGMASVRMLVAACADRRLRRHVAATSLLDEPEAWLEGVRPGLALYRGALRVSTRLVTVRQTRGPIGYTRFESPCVGVILAGYSQFLRPAPVLVNGRRQRLIEVGMNTGFVTLNPADQVGDEVVLLGEALDELTLARELEIRPQEALCRYAGMGPREY